MTVGLRLGHSPHWVRHMNQIADDRSLRAAHAFVWIGFWVAAYQAWSEGDWGLLAVSLILLGIGLLIARGVGFFMHVWVLWAAYISAREIREAEELRNGEDEDE